jgi:NAD(P)-dependent dehydrogenase (short-subunit alcohol dehydrogenase family)
MPSILITGANRGLGLEFAKQYAEAGYRVFAAVRDPQRADSLRALAARHPQLSVHAVEVTDPASVRTLAEQLAHEPLDILLNNAGWYGPQQQSVGKLDLDGFLETLRVNTVAPLRMVDAFLPHVEKGQRKLLIAVTSGMGSIAESSGGYYAYRASKAALNMTFRNLALDLKPRGVISVVVNPGWVKTDMGGPGAQLEPPQSIGMMRKIFDALTPDDSGKFLNYRGGTLPW